MNLTRSRRIALAAAAALLGGTLILSSSPASGATASPCTDPAQISVGSAAPRLEAAGIQLPGGFSILPLEASHKTEVLREALASVACAVAVPAPTVESGEVLQPAPLTGVKSSKSPNCRVV